MKLDDQWMKAENYAYLVQLKGRDSVAGWAWEFIRRSMSYRNAYADLEHLRHEYGSLWLEKQPHDLYDPPKLAGESDNAHMLRVAGLGLQKKLISISKQRARTWLLRDMYDPDMPYDKSVIQFVARNSFPTFYADERVAHIPAIQPFEDLLHDYVDTDTRQLLFVAFDTTRPLNEQLKKLRPVFAEYRKDFEIKTNDNKGHGEHYVLYLQFLDARALRPEMKLIEILKVIGKPAMRGDPYEAASELHGQAVRMTTEGYKGLLFQLENH